MKENFICICEKMNSCNVTFSDKIAMYGSYDVTRKFFSTLVYNTIQLTEQKMATMSIVNRVIAKISLA